MLSSIPSHYYVIGSTIMAILMGSFVMVIRMRASKKPTNEKKIIIPPIAMSSGALMFLFEQFRVPPMQILEDGSCRNGVLDDFNRYFKI